MQVGDLIYDRLSALFGIVINTITQPPILEIRGTNTLLALVLHSNGIVSYVEECDAEVISENR